MWYARRMSEQFSPGSAPDSRPVSREVPDERSAKIREELRRWISEELSKKAQWEGGDREGPPGYDPHAEQVTDVDALPEWVLDMWQAVQDGTVTPEQWYAFDEKYRVVQNMRALLANKANPLLAKKGF